MMSEESKTVNGSVDESLRAFLSVSVAATKDADRTLLLADRKLGIDYKSKLVMLD